MTAETAPMRMSILLYDGFTTLEIVGGYESLARIPNMQTEFVAKEVGIYMRHHGANAPSNGIKHLA